MEKFELLKNIGLDNVLKDIVDTSILQEQGRTYENQVGTEVYYLELIAVD